MTFDAARASMNSSGQVHEAGAIVLAGGRSSRLRQNKCWLSLAEERVLEKIIRILNQLAGEVILVLSPGQTSPISNYRFRIREAVDAYPDRGPLVGLYSGLRLSKYPHSLAVACDMPFLNPRLLRYMLTLCSDFDVVIPRVEGKVEPLHAVYSKDCLPIMQEMLARGDSKISNLLDQVKVRYVEGKELGALDPEHLSFFNINSPEDLALAEDIIQQRKGAKC